MNSITQIYKVINRQDVVELFRQFMQPASSHRVLRLCGEAKIGKSHLVAKVFPRLAEEECQARCAVLDLRSATQTVPDILHSACGQIGDDLFPAYHAAYQEWLNRPRVEVKGLQALFSRVQVRAGEDESSKWDRHLTVQFVADLRELNGEALLLLFDAVEDAKASILSWLTGTLLERLARLDHVRVVLAGRSVPEALGSYVAICCSRELPPVQEDEEYITYCQAIGSKLEEHVIRVLAQASAYRPGSFVELLYTYTLEAVHD